MLPPPRRPFLLSRSRHRRTSDLAYARRCFEARRAFRGVFFRPAIGWWNRLAELYARSQSVSPKPGSAYNLPVLAEARRGGTATVRLS